MITPPSGLVENMNSATRNPFAVINIAWNNVISSGEWFRFDQTQLDTGALMTAETYQLGETINELINEIDAFVYDNESAYIKTIEGYSEFIGDSYQYSVSDFDCDLVNYDNRFTPSKNKNLLRNPGFENSFDFWNLSAGSGDIYIDTDEVNTGIRSCTFRNSTTDYLFSNLVPLNDGLVIDTDTDYTFSSYINGSGVGRVSMKTYGADAYGFENLASGLIDTSYFDVTVSGYWGRGSNTMTVASGAAYVRIVVEQNSGSMLYVDDSQIEIGDTLTEIDTEYIGDRIVPKRPIKVEVGFGNLTVPKFAGLINKLDPKLKDDTIHIYAYDWADRVKDTLISGELYQDMRPDELIAILADKSGISAERRKLEISNKTLDFAYFPEASAWFYMTQIAEAEGGRVFFDEEGTLTFWNKEHMTDYGSPVFNLTMDDHILDLDYAISKENIKNRIIVNASPRDLLTRRIIYNDNNSPSVAPGETVEFWCQFNYNSDASIPAINVEVPTIGTEIIANSESDGSGINKNAQISISSSYIFAESMRINISNSGPDPVYLTKFLIYGEPIVIVQKIDVTREDVESQYLYDIQELKIENDFIDNYEFAETLATTRLAELKEPKNFLKIKVVGIPYLQLGDIVSVENDFDGNSENYRIVKNKWMLDIDDDFIQDLDLEKQIIL